MQKLSKYITMYRIPASCNEVSIEHIQEEWFLTYIDNEKKHIVKLHNGRVESSIMCINDWNTAVFVRTEWPDRPFVFPFGKYKGKRVDEVPSHYVKWWDKKMQEDDTD